MKLRIRPAGIRACKVRVVRPSSSADVGLALFLSASCVAIALVFFTILCWRVGSELGALPQFPADQGVLSQRIPLLLLALIGWLFAKLIESFVAGFPTVNTLKDEASTADELPADGLCDLLSASE
jgi:hypothetical protein